MDKKRLYVGCNIMVILSSHVFFLLITLKNKQGFREIAKETSVNNILEGLKQIKRGP